ncbi:hypothetical protein HanRHA438_Chr02g0050671 [Helianthus annuus]|uniref:DUF4283 domain-containing protein n=1 Tax=Helianthus annuus TaxID=4232 RepID=A0A9K3JKV1_HELAN|nr:hypothetical protein HanXRQr2_Chr02g0049511 [Helianthus annuus]KAJ0603612.1 hypothetical protein HanHA300_Chr02g0040231 [Helianthus annuus]KAJ0613785.1 hypothetical protein HanIR_Chr02g0055231 [Helianthus annuus]KAJ0617575.1 hypothetical protein HanHA89_Chr02g0043341 [Helianthus annuus]KAJ0776110.1 hypothetical protein HanLR1_Chr02g0041861 [Helianthus annuus]
MEKEMKDVWMGSYKLFISLARFMDAEKIQREDSVKKQDKVYGSKKQARDQEGNQDGRRGNNLGSSFVGKRLFRDILSNKDPDGSVEMIKIDDNVQAFQQWNDCAMMGKVRNFDFLVSFRTCMSASGFGSAMIKYVGGFGVMLVFKNKEEMVRFFEAKDMWSLWFDKLEIWKGQVWDVVRIAWIKVHGVPVHLCMNPIFNVIGARYGKVVKEAQVNEDDSDLSSISLAVLCNKVGRIQERVTLKWKEHSFSAWIEEEVGEWISDCLFEDDDESQDSSETDRDFVDGEDENSSTEPVDNNANVDLNVSDNMSGVGFDNVGRVNDEENGYVPVNLDANKSVLGKTKKRGKY